MSLAKQFGDDNLFDTEWELRTHFANVFAKINYSSEYPKETAVRNNALSHLQSSRSIYQPKNSDQLLVVK